MTKKRTVIITKLTSQLNIWCKTKTLGITKIPSFFVIFSIQFHLILSTSSSSVLKFLIIIAYDFSNFGIEFAKFRM